MVATCGVGYDNLPLSYLKERSIKASNTGGFKRRSLRISYWHDASSVTSPS
ncbi:hypothetical protein [Polynucleobacter necessarius]|uniref:hypothetical protein n=1 Tax=Polynucleobacter necessarius TaxID=576610 RepID=UPI001E5ED2C3|nr:hypothetical protein [Polynucleobacter necessarius]